MKIQITNQNVDMGYQIILSDIPHLSVKEVAEAVVDAVRALELGAL